MSAYFPAVRWFTPLLAVLFLTLAIRPPGSIAQGPTTPFVEQWLSSTAGRAPSVAWADVDNDGDNDLVLGIEFDSDLDRDTGGGVSIYLNTGRSLPSYPAWSSGELENVSDLALVDVNGDGKLDLTFADSQAQSRIYFNTSNHTGDFQAFDTGLMLPSATSIAWADADGDGDSDLFLGSATLAQVFRNDSAGDQGIILTSVYVTTTLNVQDAVWADYNADGRADLALATDNNGLRILQNTTISGQPIDFRPVSLTISPVATTSGARTLVAGNFAGGEETDFIVGFRATRELYTYTGGAYIASTIAGGGAAALAAGDYNGDGKLDVAIGSNSNIEVLRNNAPSAPAFTSIWINSPFNVTSLAWADYDRDGDLDLAQGVFNQPAIVFRNTRLEVGSAVQVRLEGQNTAGALVYRLRSDGGTLFQPYVDAQGQPLVTDTNGQLAVGVDIAPGDELLALVPDFDYRSFTSADVPKVISNETVSIITSTITITENNRLRAMRVKLNGTHSEVNDLVFSLISPAGREVILANRLCSGAAGFALTFADDGPAFPAQCTYTGTAQPEEPLASFAGQTMAGTWTLQIEDAADGDGGALTSWGLEIDTAPYRRYTSSAVPLAEGVQAFTVEGGGLQALSFNATNTLLVFDLSVSLEWDARNDSAYLQQLEFDLRRTAELLYDYTDGQATLGNITVYHQRKRWKTADVRVYATNRLRPNAQKGGISDQVIFDPDTEEVAYSPGEVRIGAVWNRFGNATGTVGADWPQSLAHELGHYLFYLDDNYIGLDANDQLIRVDLCPGAMSDPYREDYSEFSPLEGWLPVCERTLSQVFTRRSDWQTISKFYPELRAPTSYSGNPGPSYLPIDLVRISYDEPADPALSFASPSFDIVNRDGGRVIPGESARAFLFRENEIVDLGRPVVDKVEARGAQPGDVICVYEPAASRLGCSRRIETVTDKIVLSEPLANYPFEVTITPISTDTIGIDLTLSTTSVITRVNLAFYQPELNAVRQVIAQPESSAAGLAQVRYTATIKAAGAIDTGFLHVAVDEAGPQARSLVVDYAQLGRYSLAPDTGRTTLQSNRPCPLPTPPGCGNSRAPTASADGQAFLYGRIVNYVAGNYYSLQGRQVVPQTPAWRLPVGRAYRFVSSPGAIALSGISINISYLENEIPYGSEGGIGIYFQPAAGGYWRLLPTTRFDPARNEVAARLVGDGTYLLMTALPLQNGWNNISFPWQEPVPLLTALERLSAAYYTTIYGYNANLGGDPWQVYDIAAPAYVNDLTTMEYGRGYWMALEGLPSVSPAARTSANVPVPPATYYGPLLASSTFSPTVGLKVQAVIGEKVCGEATTINHQDRIVFAITVPADDGAAYAGCGAVGRAITFTANGNLLPYNVLWSNDRPRELRLLRAPMVFR